MNRTHIFLAVFCGLSVVIYMLFRDISTDAFTAVHFTSRMCIGILWAVAFFLLYNYLLVWRYRMLTCETLSWVQCFRVDILCEFTSSITPAALGGSGLILFFLNHEGMSVGRSTATMISALFLDELVMTVGCVLVALSVPPEMLFSSSGIVRTGTIWIFTIVVSGIALWTALLYVALFHCPHKVGRCMKALFSLPFLRRWQSKMESVFRISRRLVQSLCGGQRHSIRFFHLLCESSNRFRTPMGDVDCGIGQSNAWGKRAKRIHVQRLI